MTASETEAAEDEFTLELPILMSRVMADIGAIGKTDRNDQQNYSFRGIDSVINAVHGAMTKHHVTVTPQVIDKEYSSYQTRNNTAMRVAVVTVRYTFHGPQGDTMDVITVGEASDSADKATNKALSAALKYALLHTFVVPTEDMKRDDADRTGEERGDQIVNLREFIFGKLSKRERELLAEAWAADYDFKSWAVPFEREEECRKLVNSYVGVAPDEATSEAPATEDETINLSDLIEPLSQAQRKQLAQDWQWKFGADAVPREQEVEVRTLISQVTA